MFGNELYMQDQIMYGQNSCDLKIVGQIDFGQNAEFILDKK